MGDIASLNPPFVVVITEEWANVIVFPFRRGNDLLANCVDLEHILLHTMNSELLSFILLFTNPSGSALKPFSFPRYGGTPVSMEGLLYEIVTDTKINNSLTMKNKQLRAKLKKVRKTLAQAMHSQ